MRDAGRARREETRLPLSIFAFAAGLAGGGPLAVSIQTALERESGDPGRAMSQSGLAFYVSMIAFTYFVVGQQYSRTASGWLRQTSWWSSRIVAVLLLVAAPLAWLLAFTVPRPGPDGYRAAAIIGAGIGTVCQIATIWWLAHNWNK